MWTILETKDVQKTAPTMMAALRKRYDKWKDLVSQHGPSILRTMPGLHDEQLHGKLSHLRSSRLNVQFRIIYSIDDVNRCVVVHSLDTHAYRP